MLAKDGLESSVKPLHHPITLRVVDSRVQLADSQQLAHILHEMGQQVGSLIGQQSLRYSKHRHYFFHQKTSEMNGLLVGDRKHQWPLREKVETPLHACYQPQS